MNAGTTPGRAASVLGAGIAGSWVALMLARAGLDVTVHEAGPADLSASTSMRAGGMLAPDCESEAADDIVVRLGRRSVALWRAEPGLATMAGSLVVAHPRDRGDLIRFARQTGNHRDLDAAALADTEPALAGRFGQALLFPDEGHVEPAAALAALRRQAEALGVRFAFDQPRTDQDLSGLVVDCRGLAARADLAELRGVRGETVLVETPDVTLRRPVRLMHPRWPLYVIPRPGNRFFIGATTVESEDRSGVSVRSALELMTAAYALHPAFAEARIVALGTGLRPAFPDNAPRIVVKGRVVAVNGLYRHGFLLAPALAEIVAGYVVHGQRDNEVMRWS